MYKMDNDLKNDYVGCDYYSSFIKKSIKDLKKEGVCYVFKKEQVDEILKYIKVPVEIINNGCGYTLSVSKKYRKEIYYDTM